MNNQPLKSIITNFLSWYFLNGKNSRQKPEISFADIKPSAVTEGYSYLAPLGLKPNKLFTFFILLFLFGNATVAQQEPLTLSLTETVNRAREKSPSYFRAENLAENRYWNYRQYRATNLPQLTFNGTLPDYSSAISRVVQEDGTFAFRQSEQTFLSGQLSLDQNVPLTGGRFSISSSLQRTNVTSPVQRNDYFSTPISMSYIQPMILYNQQKWANRIQPLLYKESKQAYDEEMERIALEASNLYFNALTALTRKEIAEINVSNNDTLFVISEGRYNLGKIAENDLLQMELNLLNAKNQLSSSNLDYEVATQALKRYLDIPTDQPLELTIPTNVPVMTVPLEKAMEMAKQNRPAVMEFRRRRMEAEEQIAQARGQSGYNLNVRANFGVSKQANDFNQAYIDPLNQQNLAVGITIPIVDWGQAKSQVRRAKANRDLVEVDVQQDEINFEQEVYLQVARFNLQAEQLITARRADTIAQKRYEVTKARYLIGKISITDLNIAQAERDQARTGHLNALRAYWISYYTVRSLTLYDFINDSLINYETSF